MPGSVSLHPSSVTRISMNALRCTVGVTAHNEEANIGKLLDGLLEQELYAVQISEIVVVASGCEDRTEEIVRAYAARDPRIRLIVQAAREGKSAAVNLIVREAREAIVVIESGDTLPRRGSERRQHERHHQHDGDHGQEGEAAKPVLVSPLGAASRPPSDRGSARHPPDGSGRGTGFQLAGHLSL